MYSAMARRRNRSILTLDDEHCYMCKRFCIPEIHHIFGGPNRKNSEQYGLVVPLCHKCHNEPPYGVHFNKKNRLKLQAEAQRKYESIVDHKSFMRVFGRDYIGQYLQLLEEEQDEQFRRPGVNKPAE